MHRHRCPLLYCIVLHELRLKKEIVLYSLQGCFWLLALALALVPMQMPRNKAGGCFASNRDMKQHSRPSWDVQTPSFFFWFASLEFVKGFKLLDAEYMHEGRLSCLAGPCQLVWCGVV